MLVVQLLHLSKVTGGWHCTVSCGCREHCSSTEEHCRFWNIIVGSHCLCLCPVGLSYSDSSLMYIFFKFPVEKIQ